MKQLPHTISQPETHPEVDAALAALFHSWEQLCRSYQESLRIKRDRPPAPWPVVPTWRGLAYLKPQLNLPSPNHSEANTDSHCPV